MATGGGASCSLPESSAAVSSGGGGGRSSSSTRMSLCFYKIQVYIHFSRKMSYIHLNIQEYVIKTFLENMSYIHFSRLYYAYIY